MTLREAVLKAAEICADAYHDAPSVDARNMAWRCEYAIRALAASLPQDDVSTPSALPVQGCGEADRLAEKWLAQSPIVQIQVSLAGALLRDALHPVAASLPLETVPERMVLISRDLLDKARFYCEGEAYRGTAGASATEREVARLLAAAPESVKADK